MLQDIAVLTGAQVISEELGLKLEDVGIEQLGRARRIVIDKDRTTIIGGAGDRKAIEARTQQTRRELEKVTSDYDRDYPLPELATAEAIPGVGPVRALSHSEMKSNKDA